MRLKERNSIQKIIAGCKKLTKSLANALKFTDKGNAAYMRYAATPESIDTGNAQFFKKAKNLLKTC